VLNCAPEEAAFKELTPACQLGIEEANHVSITTKPAVQLCAERGGSKRCGSRTDGDPAIVVDAPRSYCLLMSLVETLPPSAFAIELLSEIATGQALQD